MNRMKVAQGFFGWVQVQVSDEGYACAYCWKCQRNVSPWSTSMAVTKLRAEQHAVIHSVT